ncbi:MAG: 30S ribosomal protein S12 methylthiotransferase RimO [Dissulfuribacterales bacterium]
MKIFAVSLGCPKNSIDTETTIASMLNHAGGTVVSEADDADVILVNTCGFIKSAVTESIETILTIAQGKRPHQKLAVIGCMVERYGDVLRLELPEVDFFAGTNDYKNIGMGIAKLVTEAKRVSDMNELSMPGERFLGATPPWRAYVKIAEGCSNHCTYCLIPKLRGSMVCRPPIEILKEVQELTQHGVKEITLVAQDLTAYEYSSGRNRKDLTGLLSTLVQESDVTWIRLLYLHPKGISDGLLELMAFEKRICKYLDIPIQHASTEVLRRMGRLYSTTDLENMLARIRTILPKAALRTTVMVGFPGETERDHAIVRDFLQRWEFDHAGFFVYSDEEEAPSHGLSNKVKSRIAKDREKELIRIQNDISRKKLRAMIGNTVPVLVEGVSPETEHLLIGRTEAQAPEIDGMVYINDGTARPGEMVQVLISDSDINDLVGGIVSACNN